MRFQKDPDTCRPDLILAKMPQLWVEVDDNLSFKITFALKASTPTKGERLAIDRSVIHIAGANQICILL